MRWTSLFICLFVAACSQQNQARIDTVAATSPEPVSTASPQRVISATEEQRPRSSQAPVAHLAPATGEPQEPAQAISDQKIAHQIIALSIASYSGSCPCPYNSDRAGRRCGGRSAYSRPGGYAPICFESDVTPEMIQNHRRTQVTALR